MLWPQYELLFINQEASESLEEYYSRVRELLNALHGCDHDNDSLTPVEISLRSIVIAQFVFGLREDWPASQRDLRHRLCQQHVLDHRVTLHIAFKMAEAESKRMDLENEMDDA